MGMVVRTNMAALNANNALGQASKAQQNGMQKLASGFKINKAADDASGLAISEKMKNQIKALDTAKDNCEDGANMIQTAEGYMAETHDILNRMTELAEKAANGVLADEDRKSLQDEMDQLCGEIDRIATTANFNGRKLMDGSLGGSDKITLKTAENVEKQKQYMIDARPDSSANSGIMVQIGESSTSADRLEVKINSFHTDTLFGGLGGMQNESIDDTNTEVKASVSVSAEGGNTASTYNNSVTINISDKDSASAAADAIRLISGYVSDERGKLGAQQNRLEHTVNNLTTASENTTAANSRIRDTDMAKEMMSYTSKNVIAQAAQSMLAQANSQPQNVLSLLQ
ncbi:MAG: flagellin [Oscillospiraceae bacterium]|nr:flagellin [Oscillospiraceae bacterium]